MSRRRGSTVKSSVVQTTLISFILYVFLYSWNETPNFTPGLIHPRLELYPVTFDFIVYYLCLFLVTTLRGELLVEDFS